MVCLTASRSTELRGEEVMTQSAIEVNDLLKSFRRPGKPRLVAVDHISFAVPAGQIVAFLGPNGAGKTTTLDMLLGLTTPDSGQVRVLGGDARRVTSSGRLQAMFQTGGLLPDFTVAETIRVIASAHHASALVDQTIERWDLGGFASTRVGKCSGGEQQRLRLALAMLSDPEILLLDEPTSGLDVESRRRFWQNMREQTDAGRTIVFATHYIEEADGFAERVILISNGQIIADGPIADVRASVSGSTVRATLPAADHQELTSLPGVTGVTVAGDRVTLSTTEPDSVARFLLTSTSAHDLLISTTTLEDAFVELISQQAAGIQEHAA